MKYKVEQYAVALYESLERAEGKTREAIVKRFVDVLRKNGDFSRLKEIIVRYEKTYLKKQGLIKVGIESPEKLSAELKEKIEHTLGMKASFVEKVEPKLLSGIVLLLNDEILIDASGRSRIQKLLKQ